MILHVSALSDDVESIFLHLFFFQHNNLKKIQRSVMDFYKQVLHLSLDKFSQPDLAKIGMSLTGHYPNGDTSQYYACIHTYPNWIRESVLPHTCAHCMI